jgi:DNA repair protein RecO (recombination protein O)
LIGAEAMLRLFGEQESNPRAFEALTRFLDLLDEIPSRAPARPALEPLVLSFQLKLIWLAGYLPHLGGCAECGGGPPFAGYSARAGGVVCENCGAGSLPLSAGGFAGLEGLLHRPLVESGAIGLDEQASRECLTVITSSYEEHGGFRLRTLSA